MGTYSKTFGIPQGFPDLLRQFAKEVIQHQPRDIYKYGYDYFNALTSEKPITEGVLLDMPPNNDESEMGIIQLGVHEVTTEIREGSELDEQQLLFNEGITDRISLLFAKADTDGNGTLDRKEFIQVFELLRKELNLSEKDVLKVLVEADNNDDGKIDYREFIPVASEIVQARVLMAKENYTGAKTTRSSEVCAKDEAKEYLLKGLPRAELEDHIQQIFRSHDSDRSGTLDRGEVIRCIKESGLGFTRQENNLILTLIDKNSNGVIDYQDFMPICISMMIEVLSEKIQEVPQEEKALIKHITTLLNTASQGTSERLTHMAASECLNRADLGLRFVQVHAIMCEVHMTADGFVNVQDVAETAAGVITALRTLHKGQKASMDCATTDFYKSAYKKEDFSRVAGLAEQEFNDKLTTSLSGKDEQNSGVLSKGDLDAAIGEAFPDLNPKQLKALQYLAKPADENSWAYGNLVQWGFRTLQGLLENNLLMRTVSAVPLH
ncbi:unnamed protein product [Choristocarpus tenellus]